MKTTLLFIIICFTCIYTYSQVFVLDSASNGSVNITCNATLYDSGGPTGNYQNSENYVITFCSGTADCMQISFSGVFNCENGFDYLNIYDGNSTGATLLANLSGSILPGVYTTSGNCVTFRFTSDGSVTYDGFIATIICTSNCYVPPPPPINIDPCSAIQLNVDTNCIYTQYTNVSAPGSGVIAPSCAWYYNGGDVWFQADVPTSGLLTVQIDAGTISELGMAIFTGLDCNNISQILCNETSIPIELYIQSLDGLAGQTVWIMVWEQNNDSQGTFNICAYESPVHIEADTSIYTPEQLVNLLLNGCVTVQNVQYTGSQSSIGYFINGSSIGMNSGIILSTGFASPLYGFGSNDFLGEFSSGLSDSLLNTLIAPEITNDAAVLEFDFIPTSDTLRFNYIFASEEYPEYVFSFNDIFGFFISGSDPQGGNYIDYNVALIPGTTTPVSIYNINNGSSSPPNGPCMNCQYYVDNWAGAYGIAFDGFTTPLSIEIAVVPDSLYHIKLAIADANDQAFDSAVLIEKESFKVYPCYPSNISRFESENGIKIYPVPANEMINVENANNETVQMDILDFNGNTVMSKNLFSGVNEIYLSKLNSGIYFIRITSGKSVSFEKLIIQSY